MPLLMLLAAELLYSLGAGWVTVIVSAAIGTGVLVWLLKGDGIDVYNRFNDNYIWGVAALYLSMSLIVLTTHEVRMPDVDAIQRNGHIRGVVEDIRTMEYGDRILLRVKGYRNNDGREAADFKIFLFTDVTEYKVMDELEMLENIEWYIDREITQNDYERMMMQRGIYGEERMDKEHIRLTGRENRLIPPPYLLRAKFVNFIESSTLGKDAEILIRMLLMGDRTDTPSALRQQFSYSGIAHVFALSGMHLGILLGIILVLFAPLSLVFPSKVRFILAIIAVWVYVYCTGAPVSIIRAGIMSTFMLLAVVLERRNVESLNALCGAAFFILLFNPGAVHDVGFQLSFFCVLSLIAYKDTFHALSPKEYPRLFRFMNSYLALFVATLGTWSIVAYHFGTFSPAFAISNILILPLLPFYMVLAIVYLAALSIGVNLQFIAVMLDYGASGVIELTGWLGAEDGSVIHFVPHWITVVLWTTGVLSLGVYLSQRKNLDKWKKEGKVPGHHRFLPYISTLFLIGGVIAIPFTPQTKDRVRVIFKKSGYSPYIAVSHGGEPAERIPYPEGETSRWETGGVEFVMVDMNNYGGNSRTPIKVPENRERCDYLIVGNRYRSSLSDLLRYYNPEVVIDGRFSHNNDYSFTDEIREQHLPVTLHSLNDYETIIIEI